MTDNLVSVKRSGSSKYRNSKWESILSQLQVIAPNRDHSKFVKCLLCPEKLYTKYYLKSHIESQHPDEIVQSGGKTLRQSGQHHIETTQSESIDYRATISGGHLPMDCSDDSVNIITTYNEVDWDNEEEDDSDDEPDYEDEWDEESDEEFDWNEEFNLEDQATIDSNMNDPFFKKMMEMILENKLLRMISSKDANEIAVGWLELCEPHLNISAEKLAFYKKVAASDHLQNAYMDKKFGTLIKPEILEITNSDGKICKFSYLPIRHIVEKYLKNHFLLEKIVKEMEQGEKDRNSRRSKQPTTNWNSIMDGTEAVRLEETIKIEIYSDEAELCPSGHGTKQKYMLVYLTFADIPFHRRVHMDDIEMVMMINTKKLNFLGIENALPKVFSRLNADLRDLMTNGIVVDGVTRPIKASLSDFCGDNLGTYQLYGFKACFKQNAFVCRDCGAPGEDKGNNDSIQDHCKHRPLIVDVEPEELADVGVIRDFVFEGLPNITRWNSGVPDPMHDVPEGILPKVFSLILVSCVTRHGKEIVSTYKSQNPNSKRISPQQIIINTFKRFKFYHGAPSLTWVSKTKGFKLEGTALQKLETFLRFETIFFDFLDSSWNEFKLFSVTKNFTLLTFASSYSSEQEINSLSTLAIEIIDWCKKLKKDFKVYPKLHHCTHYSDLTKKFGPLSRFRNFHYEKKHQFPKKIARVMRNFMNAAFTIHHKHQAMRALLEEKNDFFNIDFWDTSKDDKPNGYFDNFPSAKPIKLPATIRPFLLKKNVLRKIKGKRDQYFHATAFYTEEGGNGQVYCYGDVFIELQEKSGNRFQHKMRNDLKYLKLYSKNKYIRYIDLNSSNEFMFMFKENNIDNHLLVPWID